MTAGPSAPTAPSGAAARSSVRADSAYYPAACCHAEPPGRRPVLGHGEHGPEGRRGHRCGASIRRDLTDVAARTARHGRGHITLHPRAGWHREHEWMAFWPVDRVSSPAPKDLNREKILTASAPRLITFLCLGTWNAGPATEIRRQSQA
jgi:hypothetical protein